MDPKLILSLIATPLGAACFVGSLLAGAFFYIAKSTHKLADSVTGSVDARVKKMETLTVTLEGVIRANSAEVLGLGIAIKHLRDDFDRLRSELQQTRSDLRQSDGQRADMTTRLAALGMSVDSLISLYRQQAAALQQQNLPGTGQASYKKKPG